MSERDTLAALLHDEQHVSFCGSDPGACIGPPFYRPVADRLIAAGVRLAPAARLCPACSIPLDDEHAAWPVGDDSYGCTRTWEPAPADTGLLEAAQAIVDEWNESLRLWLAAGEEEGDDGPAMSAIRDPDREARRVAKEAALRAAVERARVAGARGDGMTTNAGRALRTELMAHEATAAIFLDVTASIAAIEAEKEAEVRARLAEKVEGLWKRQTFLAPSEYEAAVLALIQPEGAPRERHPITGAPLCCCLGGREKCDHHAEGAKA